MKGFFMRGIFNKIKSFFNNGGEINMNIVFVCYGNSCRSPMAEYILKDMLKKEGMTDINVTSAGTHVFAKGGTMHSGSQNQLKLNDIDFDQHIRQRFTEEMYNKNDLIIAMDKMVLDYIRYLCDNQRGSFNQKLKLLRSFSIDPYDQDKDVFDPYGTNQYYIAFEQIYKACQGLILFLKKNNKKDTKKIVKVLQKKYKEFYEQRPDKKTVAISKYLSIY